MFADNKDYEQRVRGGKQPTLLLYDLKSTGKFKVDISSKANNGIAFRDMIALKLGLNGCHKLPYNYCVHHLHRFYGACGDSSSPDGSQPSLHPAARTKLK